MASWTRWAIGVCVAGCLGGAVVAETVGPDHSGEAKKAVFAVDSVAHSAWTSRIVATPDERNFVTASHDKSIRIWDAQTGQLLKRWIVPVKGYNDGELMSIALSPDGEQAAVSGFVNGLGKDKSVVIVSLRDGQIRKVLPGFTSIVWSLAWSPDGRYLAIGLGDDGVGRGLHVFEPETGKRVFTDRNVDARVMNLGFRADNTLFAVTHNPPNLASLYFYRFDNGEFQRSGMKGFGKKGGFRAYWNRDASAVYVRGHSLVNAADLTEPPHPAHARRRGEPLPMMGAREAPDGRFLYSFANQRHEKTGKFWRWVLPNGGSYDETEIPDARVTDFVALRDGTVAYVTETGVVAAMGSDLKLKWRNARQVAVIEGRPDRLRVSNDGQWISLPVEQGGKVVDQAFNVFKPRFSSVDALKQKWQEPDTGRSSMRLMTWEGTLEPAVNDRPFPKAGRERSLSVAVHSREEAFVFGSSGFYLRKVDAAGQPLWKRYLFSGVSAVNLIESKNLVVAATANGFVHLVRWSDGSLVASYYLEPGNRRWLAVASDGSYEAGIGAEDLAGWIIRGEKGRMADFFPLSRFRKERLTPDLVQRALEGAGSTPRPAAASSASPKKSVAAVPTLAPKSAPAPAPVPSPAPASGEAGDAIASALGASSGLGESELAEIEAEIPSPKTTRLPPVIDILSPGFEVATGSRQLKVRYQVRTAPEAPVTAVRTRVISASRATRGLQPKALPSMGEEMVIDLPQEDAEVQIVAENAWGSSVPASVRVRWTGERVSAKPAKGNLHVIAVGVSDYDQPDYKLGLAAKDAGDFVKTIRAQEGRLYAQVHLQVLTDKEASRSAIESAVAGLRGKVGAQDTTIVFLAGHGFNDASGEYFYLPKEANIERLEQTGLSFRKIGDELASLPGRIVMFVDTCHSGNVISKLQPGQGQNHASAVNELASSEKNIVVFASSTGGQLSLEDSRWGNGAFTKALLEGFAGKADLLKRGRVTYKQLDAYVSDRVDELTSGRQTPVTPVLQGVPDFVLAEVKK